MKLKICGLRPGDDLSFTKHEAVAYMGIIFVPKSRRYVAPNVAAAWLQQSAIGCKVIGVFVDERPETVLQIATEVGLDGVQLHGSETTDACRALKTSGLTVWKALQVPENSTGAQLRSTIRSFATVVDGILLDAAPPKDADISVTGGHGVTFDWRIIRSLFDQTGHQDDCVPFPDIWVAGGFQPSNVQAFYETCDTTPGPVGIDVSSGVEIEGRKSIDKVHEMIRVVTSLDNPAKAPIQ